MFKKLSLSAIISLILATSGFSQGNAERNTLNYTYFGPIISLGYSKVEYSDWFDSAYETKSSSGLTYAGGVALSIFADNFVGDSKLKYTYNGTDDAVTYAEFSFSGKYLWEISPNIHAGLGLGIYCETPPSNKSYDGSAGLELPMILLYNMSLDTKIFTELNLKYGSFGIGEESSHMFVGTTFGFLIKVGRI